ncbi:MAG: cytidylate kinase-like family protein, partial [Verrucomicrobia bacterium]|nr:cytidylate kinase-like family protein [Verrucomicrobiota bacterium]
GSGAMEIAQKLSDFLQARIPGSCGWAVFDKNLVTKMLEDHNLPKQLAEFLPEDRISRIKDMMEEVLGLHPPSDTLIHQISETIVHLAELGHVILVGRAAHVITRQAQNVFHVRLIAPMEKRQAQVMARRQMAPEAALDFIKKEDVARKHYLKAYFRADPDDDLLYDLVINTARFSPEEAATLIGEAVLAWTKRPV